MTYPLSRAMSVATAGYGVFALLRPRHLGTALTKDPVARAGFDTLALTYGARDLTVSTLGLLGRSERTVATAMAVRIAFDVSDGVILSSRADRAARGKVLGVTLGWATLNAVALMVDRRRAAGG
jgi:hypothetical protein